MTPVKMSRIESAVRVVIRLIDAINHHNIRVLDELFDESVMLEGADANLKSERISGQENVIKYFKTALDNHSEIALETEELIGFGNRCILRWLAILGAEKETHKVRGLSLFRIKDEKIVEILSYEKHKVSTD